jgi:hypothetical protein
MNLKTIFTLLVLLLVANSSFASFPVVRRGNTPEVQAHTSENYGKEKKKEKFKPLMGKDKSQGIALILALTLGLLAAHRWYLNKPWMINVMFIMSLGYAGIWLLGDIIRIAVRDMKPSKGRYKDNFL